MPTTLYRDRANRQSASATEREGARSAVRGSRPCRRLAQGQREGGWRERSSTAHVEGVTLSHKSTENPATIALGGYVTNDGSANNGTALFGTAAAAWTITNLGQINGESGNSSNGIELLAGGFVTNGASGSAAGLITANLNGIEIEGKPGTVVNYGAILGLGRERHRGPSRGRRHRRQPWADRGHGQRCGDRRRRRHGGQCRLDRQPRGKRRRPRQRRRGHQRRHDPGPHRRHRYQRQARRSHEFRPDPCDRGQRGRRLSATRRNSCQREGSA